MQFQGECQKVRGMYFTPVDLTWATEKNHKTAWVESGNFDRMFVELEMNSWGHATAYGRRDHIPDGYYGQDKILIKYCYYQPNIKPVRDPIIPADWDSVGMDVDGVYTYWWTANPNDRCPVTNSPTQSPTLSPTT
jgi:hypothetical protein